MNGLYEDIRGGKVLIVADDLTGAGDTAVPFAKQGSSAIVYLDGNGGFAMQEHTDVDVLHTASRSLSPESAADRVRECVANVDWSRYSLVYKKIDSTFRGNIGSELDALLAAGEFDCAVVTPAYPKQKRVVMDGYLFVDGQLLEDTPIARDPVHPVGSSYLPALLQEQSRNEVIRVPVNELRKAVGDQLHEDSCFFSLASGVKRSGNRRADAGKPCYLFDAANEDDLQRIAAAARAARLNVLWVGSAGLAEVLADGMQDSRSQPLKQEAAANRMRQGLAASVQSSSGLHDVLIVVGSVHPVARRQAAYLRELGFGWLELDPVQLASGYAELTAAQLQAWVASRKTGGWVLATVCSDDQRKRLDLMCREHGWTSREAGARIADSLGRLAARMANEWTLRGFVLTGGDIACSAMNALGIDMLQVMGEVEAGLPWYRPCGMQSSRFAIVTKAGGFGSEHALCLAAQVVGGTKEGESL